MFISKTDKKRSCAPYLYVDLGKLEKALALNVGASAIRLWLAVAWRSRVKQSNVVVLSNLLCRRFGVRHCASKARAIAAWEAAGFWRVTRSNGKNPIVEILEP